MRVCSTEYVYHYFFNHDEDKIQSVLEMGLRPLSDFPDSERWQELEADQPGFYQRVYELFGSPVIQKPYTNSGVFVTPIDFHKVPGTYLSDKPRAAIPVSRIDTEWAAMTYVINDERVGLSFTAENRKQIAALWNLDMVQEWFGKDNTKVFFHVPQVAVYQAGGIPVKADDIEYPQTK